MWKTVQSPVHHQVQRTSRRSPSLSIPELCFLNIEVDNGSSNRILGPQMLLIISQSTRWSPIKLVLSSTCIISLYSAASLNTVHCFDHSKPWCAQNLSIGCSHWMRNFAQYVVSSIGFLFISFLIIPVTWSRDFWDCYCNCLYVMDGRLVSGKSFPCFT
jgi:hypothetical protein